MSKLILICVLTILVGAAAQRITTIHLDGVQYFISRMNPYSPELNYFLAYQYCRSLGLQLASFETKEKAESMTTYLKNAGYGNYDFWTSGNRLGTGMFLWMSTGLPFNATFDFFENTDDAVQTGLLDPVDHNSNTSPQRTARDSSSGAEKGCVILKQPALKWIPEDCSAVKDFICEQTRCYYYNYGSIPVSSAQGRPITSTARPPVVMMNFHPSTTPLPIPVPTNGLFAKKPQSNIESQPSFVSLKISHERALESDFETDTDSEMEAVDDDIEAEEEERETDNSSPNEQARELNDGIKNHVFPLNDNELQRDEMHSIEKLQMQLKLKETEYNKDAYTSNTELKEEHGQEHDGAEQDTADENYSQEASLSHDNESNVKIGQTDDMLFSNKKQISQLYTKSNAMQSTTDAPGIEVRLKQIAQDFEKMTSSSEKQHDELTPQPSLSLSDLIRTLRPNDKQIIPQIDSDYSNAMRVLGKTSAVVNNDDSRKYKILKNSSHTIII